MAFFTPDPYVRPAGFITTWEVRQAMGARIAAFRAAAGGRSRVVRSPGINQPVRASSNGTGKVLTVRVQRPTNAAGDVLFQIGLTRNMTPNQNGPEFESDALGVGQPVFTLLPGEELWIQFTDPATTEAVVTEIVA
jgi:hypothetical protein